MTTPEQPPRKTMRPVWLHISAMALMFLAAINTLFLLFPIIYNYYIIGLGFVLTLIAWDIARRERYKIREWQLQQERTILHNQKQ